MDKWEINLGSVLFYNETEMEFERCDMTIFYNDEDYFPYSIELYLNDQQKSVSSSLYFDVKVKDKKKMQILINDELFVLTEKQINLLENKKQYWKVEDFSKFVNPGIDTCDLGLIYYNDIKHDIVYIADFDIQFNINAKDEKFIINIKTFDINTMLPIEQSISKMYQFDYSFIQQSDNLYWYNIANKLIGMNNSQREIFESFIDNLQ